jgi:probable rRNA maturation factor
MSEPAAIRIAFSVADKGWDKALPEAAKVARAAARRTIKAALASEALPWKRLREAAKFSLGVTLESDAGLRQLNHDYRAKNKPTNVLSFAALDAGLPPKGIPKDYPWELGDVVLALGVVRDEAKAQGKTLSQHYCHLVVHGVLHLLGFDHEDPGDAKAMEALERDVLAGLGWPDPYILK